MLSVAERNCDGVLSFQLIQKSYSGHRQLNKMNMKLKLRAVSLFSFRISTPEQVMFSGETTGESAMKTEEDIGLEVIHTYEVGSRPGDVNLCSCS